MARKSQKKNLKGKKSKAQKVRGGTELTPPPGSHGIGYGGGPITM